LQRFFDILFSSLAILALSPIMLFIALLLLCTGEHEVFYSQTRIGKNGIPFKALKFVTMLKQSPNLGTGNITVLNDPRILPVGRFLRATNLNELAQLFNILKGDMSIIGPRPLAPDVFALYDEDVASIILNVRPGLSGAGSIVFRNESDLLVSHNDPLKFYKSIIIPYKGKIETWYVHNNSIVLYIKLILFTVYAVFSAKPISKTIFGRGFPEEPKELSFLFT